MIRQVLDSQIIASQDKMLRQFVFDTAYAQAMAAHPLHARIKDWLPGGTGEKLLELGCGPGKYVAMLSTLGYQVTGVDPYEFPSWEFLRKETPAQLTNNVKAEDLPFPDNSFDHVVCLGALLYFDDPARALRELRRVIRPGGRVVIRTVNRTTRYTLRTGKKFDPASKNLYTLDELVDAVSVAGFTVAKSFTYGYRSATAPQFWWYLEAVWLTPGMQNFLSLLVRPEHRIQNIIFASTST